MQKTNKRFNLMRKFISLTLIATLIIPTLSYSSGSGNSADWFSDSSSLPQQGHTGIAAGYIVDVNIASHPDVIVAEDFEDVNSISDLRDKGWGVTNHVVNESGATDNGQTLVTLNTANKENIISGNKSLQLNLKSKDTPRHTGIDYPLVAVNQQDTVHIRYYFKIDANYDVPPGISNHNGGVISSGYWACDDEGVNGGSGPGRTANGTNKYLVEWETTASNLYDGYSMKAYVYHPDQRYNSTSPIFGYPSRTTFNGRHYDQFGDALYPDGEVMPWNSARADFGSNFISRPKFYTELDTWYCYELMLKANTPGKRDGRITTWIDGEVIADFTNMRFRDLDSMKIDLIGFSFGADKIPVETFAWYDNIVVATSYIGPIYNGTDNIVPNPASVTDDGTSVQLIARDAYSSFEYRKENDGTIYPNPTFAGIPVRITGNGTYTAKVTTVNVRNKELPASLAGLTLASKGTALNSGSNPVNFSDAKAVPLDLDWQNGKITIDAVKVNSVTVGNRDELPLVNSSGYINTMLWNGWNSTERYLTDVAIDTNEYTGLSYVGRTSTRFLLTNGNQSNDEIEVTFTVTGLPYDKLPKADCKIHIEVENGVIEIHNNTDKAISAKGLYLTDSFEEQDFIKMANAFIYHTR